MMSFCSTMFILTQAIIFKLTSAPSWTGFLTSNSVSMLTNSVLSHSAAMPSLRLLCFLMVLSFLKSRALNSWALSSKVTLSIVSSQLRFTSKPVVTCTLSNSCGSIKLLPKSFGKLIFPSFSVLSAIAGQPPVTYHSRLFVSCVPWKREPVDGPIYPFLKPLFDPVSITSAFVSLARLSTIRTVIPCLSFSSTVSQTPHWGIPELSKFLPRPKLFIETLFLNIIPLPDFFHLLYFVFCLSVLLFTLLDRGAAVFLFVKTVAIVFTFCKSENVKSIPLVSSK